MKRILPLFLALVLSVSAVTVSAAAAGTSFTDVPRGSWAEESIRRAAEQGILSGYGNGRFGYGRTMTRAAFTTALVRLFGWEPAAGAVPAFSDTDSAAWYYTAVETAYAHGAVTLQSDRFRPDDPITREEVAVMIVRALNYEALAGLVQQLPSPFTDLTTNAGYIAVAYNLGLMNGTSTETFSPDVPATREQAAAVLMRLYDKYYQKTAFVGGTMAADGKQPAGLKLNAVAVSAGEVRGTQTRFEDASARCAAIRAGGSRALLEVKLGADVLEEETAGTMTALADTLAGRADAWDGLQIDVPAVNASGAKNATALTASLAEKLGDKLLYVCVEAPAWQGESGAYDYAALGESADRLILRLASYEEDAAGFPVAPLEPLEEVYYALGELRDVVPPQKLSLMVTTTGSVWKNGKSNGSMDAGEIEALLAEKGTAAYYSSRYACAYLTKTEGRTTTVVWYLDQKALDQRQQLAAFFGVSQIWFSDLTSMSPETVERD